MISKISEKRKTSGLTITELRRRCFSWKFTRFWWYILDSALRSSCPLATFKISVLKKFGKIHGKRPVPFFSFSLIFQKKRESCRDISLQIFQILDKNFFMTPKFIWTNKNIFKVGNKATNSFMFLLWYLVMILCITWLEGQDLWWSLSS